jgi:hypothetical protein
MFLARPKGGRARRSPLSIDRNPGAENLTLDKIRFILLFNNASHL